MRLVAAGAVLVLAAWVSACAEESDPGEGPLRVYMSVPLSGERAAEGKRIAVGAERVLEDAGGRAGGHQIELEVLDDTGGGARWNPAATGANARRATEDAGTIAFIGDLDRSATATSLAITGLAEIPQIVLGEMPPDLDVENEVLLVPEAARPDPGAAAMQIVLDAIEAAGEDATDRLTVRDRLREQVAAAVS